MLSVRGQGSNAEIDSLLPTLTNTSTGKIVVDSEDGFGMASFNGGTVTNNGSITMKSKSTGMRTNNGILTNGTNATITLENNGSGMVLKSGDPTTDTAASDGDGSGDSGDDGRKRRYDGRQFGHFLRDQAGSEPGAGRHNGTITINNADDAKGIFIEDGTAINNGSGIVITNTSRVPSAASYGIKAEKGTVENNSKIDMNVLVSTDGSTSVDSYGIFSDSANITNGVNGASFSANAAPALQQRQAGLSIWAVSSLNRAAPVFRRPTATSITPKTPRLSLTTTTRRPVRELWLRRAK